MVTLLDFVSECTLPRGWSSDAVVTTVYHKALCVPVGYPGGPPHSGRV